MEHTNRTYQSAYSAGRVLNKGGAKLDYDELCTLARGLRKARGAVSVIDIMVAKDGLSRLVGYLVTEALERRTSDAAALDYLRGVGYKKFGKLEIEYVKIACPCGSFDFAPLTTGILGVDLPENIAYLLDFSDLSFSGELCHDPARHLIIENFTL